MLAQVPMQKTPLTQIPVTQVTLTLHQPILEQAQRYAKAHNTDISRMVEGYFSSFLLADFVKNSSANQVAESSQKLSITEQLSGVLKSADSGEDYKQMLEQARQERFAEKHS